MGTEVEGHSTLPALRQHDIAPHGEAGVQVGIQDFERSLVTIQQCKELDEGGAACRVTARAANGSFTGALKC